MADRRPWIHEPRPIEEFLERPLYTIATNPKKVLLTAYGIIKTALNTYDEITFRTGRAQIKAVRADASERYTTAETEARKLLYGEPVEIPGWAEYEQRQAKLKRLQEATPELARNAWDSRRQARRVLASVEFTGETHGSPDPMHFLDAKAKSVATGESKASTRFNQQ
jgi:hypothetical protein